MDEIQRTQIIDAISRIPSDQRDDVLTRARPFITDGMSGHSRAQIINAISRIPSDQRDDVLTRARPFITDGMSGPNRASIIDAIREIPQVQRQRVAQDVQTRLQEDEQAGRVSPAPDDRARYIADIFRPFANPNPHPVGGATEIHRFAETKVAMPATGEACKATPEKKSLNEAITENIEGRLKGAKVKIVDLDEAKRVTAEAIDRVYPCPTSGQCPRHQQALRALGIIVENAEGKLYLPLTITFLQQFHPDKLDLWTQQSMGESTEAYGENTMSCTKGIQERIFTGLRGIDPKIDKLISPVEGLFMLKNAFADSNIGDKDSTRRMAGRLIERGYTRRTTEEQAIKMYRDYLREKMREAGAENDKEYEDQLKMLMEIIEEFFDEKLKPVLEELLTKGSPAGSREHSRSSSPKVRATSRSRSSSTVRLGPASDDLDTRRRLIAEQDVAYEASLRADQEKERRRREEAATNQAGPDETSRPLSPGKLRKARLKALEKKNPKAKKDSDSEE